MAPGNLQLGQARNGSLILTWNRPTNMRDEINVTYIVTITSMEESGTNFEATFNTPALFLSINTSTDALVNSTACQLFQFTVQGWNLAGIGNTSTPIVDTIPICKHFCVIVIPSCNLCHVHYAAPDVENISKELTVDSVALEPLIIDISFPVSTIIIIHCANNNIGFDLVGLSRLIMHGTDGLWF